MRAFIASLVVMGGVAAATATPPHNAPASATTDLYHVHFNKAAPGQAAALGKSLATPDKTTAMPDHFVVLRHQEGDDWDYVVIQHLGPKTELTTATPPQAATQRPLSAWHSDTFVAGPSWADFSREMGLGSGGSVYIVGVHRPVPGHRDQLLASLNAPGPPSKIQVGNVTLQHVEGGEWSFATITRYNSWTDLAADRASAPATADVAGGWADIRQHSAFHRDTITDRIYPAK